MINKENVHSNKMSCYTIGHSVHTLEDFIHILKDNNVNYVIDIRSRPYNNYVRHFNRGFLSEKLKEHNIFYLYLGKELGDKCVNRDLLSSNGKVDFEKVSRTLKFNNGINKIIEKLEVGYNISLMCSEGDPYKCHRFVLISHALSKKGISIRHILKDRSIISNEMLEEKLLNNYEKDYQQATLYGNVKTKWQAIESAYKKRGEDIAYKPGRHEITDEKSIFINDLDKPRGTEELGEMEEPEGPKL